MGEKTRTFLLSSFSWSFTLPFFSSNHRSDGISPIKKNNNNNPRGWEIQLACVLFVCWSQAMTLSLHCYQHALVLLAIFGSWSQKYAGDINNSFLEIGQKDTALTLARGTYCNSIRTHANSTGKEQEEKRRVWDRQITCKHTRAQPKGALLQVKEDVMFPSPPYITTGKYGSSWFTSSPACMDVANASRAQFCSKDRPKVLLWITDDVSYSVEGFSEVKRRSYSQSKLLRNPCSIQKKENIYLWGK